MLSAGTEDPSREGQEVEGLRGHLIREVRGHQVSFPPFVQAAIPSNPEVAALKKEAGQGFVKK